MRQVYVIEVDSKWHPEVAAGLAGERRCFHVGETSKPPSRRLREHLVGRCGPEHGRDAPGGVFGRMRRSQGETALERGTDARLRFDLMEDLEPVEDAVTAAELVAEVVDRLRGEGHCVYPERAGQIPFESFRRAPG